MEHLQQVLEHGIYFFLILVLVLCGIGLPIPEEVVFLTAGYAASQVHANVWLVCLSGVIGILLGDSIPFLLGKYHGMSLMQWRMFSRVLTEKRLARTRAFFDLHGSKTVFFARFVAGLRVPTFFVSATMGVRYRVFILWNGLGALISCPISIYVAYRFGPDAERLLRDSKPFVIGVLAAILFMFFAIHFFRSRKKAGADGDSNAAASNPASEKSPDERARELPIAEKMSDSAAVIRPKIQTRP